MIRSGWSRRPSQQSKCTHYYSVRMCKLKDGPCRRIGGVKLKSRLTRQWRQSYVSDITLASHGACYPRSWHKSIRGQLNSSRGGDQRVVR
jgi:hypothetical protein